MFATVSEQKDLRSNRLKNTDGNSRCLIMFIN